MHSIDIAQRGGWWCMTARVCGWVCARAVKHTCRAMTSFKLCCSFSRSLHNWAISLMDGSRLVHIRETHCPHIAVALHTHCSHATPLPPTNPPTHQPTTRSAHATGQCRSQSPTRVLSTRTQRLVWALGPVGGPPCTWTGPRPPCGRQGHHSHYHRAWALGHTNVTDKITGKHALPNRGAQSRGAGVQT
jgi:hypothetical protein